VSGPFDQDSGALCLDFANTVDWHDSDRPQDRLGGYADLVRWGEAAGVVSARQAEKLQEMALSQPDEAALAFDQAVQLREAIYRLFSDFSARGIVNQGDLVLLNGALSESLAHLSVILTDDGFGWQWSENKNDLERIIWPVARSAGDLLTGGTLDRVSQCADDRGCGYLFVDTSRNRSRRWCSMESCGNRAKARRHYRKQQTDRPEKA
jgi:predicted RNA-binding Zn ribbon-like protein